MSKEKVLKMPTADIAKPQAIAVVSRQPKLNKHERRKLRNMAYHQIKKNSKGVSKGIVKQAAFVRSKQAFAMMDEIAICAGPCHRQLLRRNLDNANLCSECKPVSKGV